MSAEKRGPGGLVMLAQGAEPPETPRKPFGVHWAGLLPGSIPAPPTRRPASLGWPPALSVQCPGELWITLTLKRFKPLPGIDPDPQGRAVDVASHVEDRVAPCFAGAAWLNRRFPARSFLNIFSPATT